MYGAKQALHNASVSYKFDYEESVKRCLGEALFIGFGAPEVRKCEVVSEKVVVQTLDKPADKPLNKPLNEALNKPSAEEEEEDAPEIVVRVFKWNGVSYLRSVVGGVIYDKFTNEPLGVWNAKENNIEFDGPESEDELMTDIGDEGEGEGEVAPKASTVGRVRNNIDREATRDAIPDRMVLRASGPNPKQKGNDVVLDVIYRASTKTFYRYGKGVKTEYKTLQDANREWCMTRNGHTKLENAWTAFRALDREGILKPKAINELHTAGGNWTTNISHVTLNRFIDKTFKF